jgi:Nucleoside 2-deoxyribosyltransferase
VRVYFAGPLFTPYEREFIGACAERLRAEGFEVFVPHENELAAAETSPARILAKDLAGLEPAEALVALLDGPMVDDGTACEIGIFHGLMRADPAKKGVVGLLTDLRGTLGGGHDVNLFVRGCIEASGEIVGTLDEAVAVLRRWQSSEPTPPRK